MSRNKRYIYKLRTDNLISEEDIPYTAYGITVFDASTMDILDSVPDVFFDKDKAQNFISLCNELELDIIHLYDVIEDEIC